MAFYLGDIEISDALDKDGDLLIELFDIKMYVDKKRLLELREHIEKVLLDDISEHVKKQFNLELAKNGEIGKRITNSEIARIIDIYNKLK